MLATKPQFAFTTKIYFLRFKFCALKGAVNLSDQLVFYCCLQRFCVGNKLDLIFFVRVEANLLCRVLYDKTKQYTTLKSQQPVLS